MSPLLRGKKNIGRNIKELKMSGKKRSKKQIIAIALNTAGISKKKKVKRIESICINKAGSI